MKSFLAIASLLLVTACQKDTGKTSTKTSARKKTFVYCSEGSPSAFNPQITTDGTSNNASAYTIYNRLVEFKKGTTEIIPSLASSWEISADKLNYTFKLRKDVKFHTTKYFTPSRNFNADDVIFSFYRMKDANHPYHKVGGGTYEYFNGMDMGNLVKSVTKTDDHTVIISLNKPEAPFLANMAMSFMSIISKEYGEHLLKAGRTGDMDNMPIGTGPFIFKTYSKDNFVRFFKNPEFFGTPAKIDNLVFSITPDASVRFQKLKAGECHLIIEPSPADLTAMESNGAIKLMKGSGLNVGYLAMNTQKKPFDNLLVRQAVNHALNKESYIKAIYMGHAKTAKNPLPPTIWSYNDKITDYEYNPQKAKDLLAKAGMANGFETELWTLPVTRPYNPNGKKMGEMMQADLAKVGIKVKLISYDWPTYLKKSAAGEHVMVQLGWSGDNGDPDNFLHVLLGCSAVKAGSNYARWCNQDFNGLIEKAKRTTEIATRTSLYEKAQKIFKEKAPWVPIAHSTVFRAMSNKVKNYIIDPLGGDIFSSVDIE